MTRFCSIFRLFSVILPCTVAIFTLSALGGCSKEKADWLHHHSKPKAEEMGI